MPGATYRKQRRDAPRGFFACEVAGLRWITVPEGPRVVRVLAEGPDGLELELLHPARATAEAAAAFGTSLAHLHDAGAPAFGAPPDGWGSDGFFGPLEQPLPLRRGHHERWGEFYADCRVDQVRDLLIERDRLSPGLAADLGRVAARLRRGDWDDGEAPARVHGDLWSGNVFWAAGPHDRPDRTAAVEAVLIDPAAHGGHRLADLAMLELFGLPHLETVLDAYDVVHPLPAGWRTVLGLHQIYPVGMHAVLFGGGYVDRLAVLCAQYS